MQDVTQGSYNYEKPGKVMEFQTSNFQAWKSFGKINKARKFWKSLRNQFQNMYRIEYML